MLFQVFSKIKSRFSAPVYVFGRWANDETFNKKKLKVDYANEDHCFCDDYLQNKIRERDEKKNKNSPHKPVYFASKKDFTLWEMKSNKFKN